MLSWVGRARCLPCLFLFMRFSNNELPKATFEPRSRNRAKYAQDLQASPDSVAETAAPRVSATPAAKRLSPTFAPANRRHACRFQALGYSCGQSLRRASLSAAFAERHVMSPEATIASQGLQPTVRRRRLTEL